MTDTASTPGPIAPASAKLIERIRALMRMAERTVALAERFALVIHKVNSTRPLPELRYLKAGRRNR